MKGDIARAITLATYGTAFLRDNYNINKLTLEHPSFMFENKVEFLVFKKHFWRKPTWFNYAGNPIDWLKKLKEEGCKEIRMSFIDDNSVSLNGEKVPDYKLAGFVGGGGTRYIQTVFSDHSDMWQCREEVTNKNAPDNRIWSISYGRSLPGLQIQSTKKYDIENIKQRLKYKLTEISAFANEEKLTFWAEWFQNALHQLDSATPFDEGKVDQIIPPGTIDLKTSQLLAGSSKAWCFGGMGSWNDVGFTEKNTEDLYDRLTSELYDIVNESYIAVANSY